MKKKKRKLNTTCTMAQQSETPSPLTVPEMAEERAKIAQQTQDDVIAAALKSTKSVPEEEATLETEALSNRRLRREQRKRRRTLAKEEQLRQKAATLTLQEAMQEERDSGVFSLRTVVRMIWEHWLAFCVVGFVCVCVLSAMACIQSSCKATVVMSLNYEESVKGLTPNGTRYDLSEFRSDECMELAIAAAGLQDQLTTDELAEMISISPYANGRVSTSSDSYYINSSYKITLTMPQEYLWQITTEDMLLLICQSYNTVFRQNYIVTAKALQGDDPDLETMDYTEISSYMSMMINRALRYLDVRQNSASAFISSDGSTFKTLRQQVTNLRDYDVARYDSYVWENGLSKELERRINTLNYCNTQLEWDYEEAMNTSAALRQIVDDYNNAMTSSVLIPTYDESGEFYMARTKTGIDDITKEADSYLAEAVSASKTIATNEDRLSKLCTDVTAEEYATADAMAESMTEKLDTIIDQIIDLDEEYNDTVTGDYITFRVTTKSLVRRLGLKRALAVAVGLCAVMYVYWAVRRKRQLRRLIAWMQSTEK